MRAPASPSRAVLRREAAGEQVSGPQAEPVTGAVAGDVRRASSPSIEGAVGHDDCTSSGRRRPGLPRDELDQGVGHDRPLHRRHQPPWRQAARVSAACTATAWATGSRRETGPSRRARVGSSRGARARRGGTARRRPWRRPVGAGPHPTLDLAITPRPRHLPSGRRDQCWRRRPRRRLGCAMWVDAAGGADDAGAALVDRADRQGGEGVGRCRTRLTAAFAESGATAGGLVAGEAHLRRDSGAQEHTRRVTERAGCRGLEGVWLSSRTRARSRARTHAVEIACVGARLQPRHGAAPAASAWESTKRSVSLTCAAAQAALVRSRVVRASMSSASSKDRTSIEASSAARRRTR